MSTKTGGGRVYLFAPDFSEGKELADKIPRSFFKRAFLTDAVLVLLLDETLEAVHYHLEQWRVVLCSSCKFQPLFKSQVNLEQLFRVVDYYIIGNSPEELRYIDLAMKNNVEIIGTREHPDDVFKDIVVDENVEQFKKHLYSEITEKIFNRFPPQEYEYFLFHDGLGELLAFFYWLKEYRKYTDKKIFTLCLQNTRMELAKICPYVDMVAKIDNYTYDYTSIYLKERYGVRNVFETYNVPKCVEFMKELPIYLRNVPNGILSTRKRYLDIPLDVKFERYSVDLPEESTAKAKEVFEDMNFKEGRVVFLNTMGVTTGDSSFRDEFWGNLSRSFIELGYDVVINGNDYKIPGCKNIFLSLLESSVFVGLCGNLISVDTGFSEAMCSLNSVDPIRACFICRSNKDMWKNSGVVGKVIMLNDLRYYGKIFAEKKTEGYGDYLRSIFGSNVKSSSHVWGDSVEENNALAERLINEITDRKKQIGGQNV